ncbi:MAG TPA: hypothetical protein VLS45_07285, partial [Methylomicrobium sp.]|nr:hypothetical protein [Methylomicrobium sp.]
RAEDIWPGRIVQELDELFGQPFMPLNDTFFEMDATLLDFVGEFGLLFLQFLEQFIFEVFDFADQKIEVVGHEKFLKS